MAGTANVYRWVIDDVIAKMKPEVVQEGLEESVLDDLRALWEAKLTEKGLLDPDEPPPPPQRSMPAVPQALPPVHALPPGLTLPSGIQAGPSAQAIALQFLTAQLAARAAAAQAQAQGGGGGSQPATLPFNPAMLLGIKRDAPDSGFDPRTSQQRPAFVIPPQLGGFQPRPTIPQQQQQPNHIPQRDGADDEEGNDGEDAEAAQPQAPDDDEDPLSSDSESDEPEDEDHKNFLCCQFEKVSRTKNKWKIAMREGVFHINGKDYLFKKAQGEWIF